MDRRLINFVRANFPYAIIALLAIACVALVIFVVRVSSRRLLTPLESTLLQVVILATGVSASYLFSQRSARVAAEQIVKPHARSAFRRVKNLYSGLFQMKGLIDRHHEKPSEQDSSQVVDIIEAMVNLQVITVSDAMDDWREFVPEEVADLERQLGGQDRG